SLGFNEVTVRKNYYPTQDGGRENAVVMALYM
ncbi:ribosomal-protein-alanine N-acetyltransferase, partial [Glaesserella parasuis]|nr:ribosomal-protein-alanine N-acetyltransferase [Glaesserella parasuis]